MDTVGFVVAVLPVASRNGHLTRFSTILQLIQPIVLKMPCTEVDFRDAMGLQHKPRKLPRAVGETGFQAT